MVPGFTAVPLPIFPASPPAIQAAGAWDTPGGDCQYARTDTFCTALVLWCKEVFVCRDGTFHGYETTKTPYPCGICVGISDPSDW
jgi:hypothetical protein